MELTGSSSPTGTLRASSPSAPPTVAGSSCAIRRRSASEPPSTSGRSTAVVAAQATPFTVVDIPYLADTTAPDVAFLRITGQNLPSPLVLADDEATIDDLVALVGYPAHDPRNDADAMAKYFKDLYDVKRYAPGRITQSLAPGVALRHDCTTLGGNSGSPLIRLTDNKVVGLHYSGVFGQYNSAVGADSLRQLLKDGRPSTTLPAEPAVVQESVRDGGHEPADLEGRAGYDPDFLGGGDLAAPWPGLPDTVKGDLATPSDELPGQPFELRYTHFGVKFSRSRKQPRMTAVNIDGVHMVAIKRTSDKWFHDGRIDRDIQLSKDDYADPEIDRGHLVRRQDPNWDDSLPRGQSISALAQQANDDTFHYTNSAVQDGEFNSGSKQWLGLEDFVLTSAKTHGFRACVFTGPVQRDEDEEIAPGVIAPREFFKLVVMPSAEPGKLHATAYLLSQGDMIRELLEKRSRVEAVEGFELGAYRTFQISIADLADGTGYDFSRYIPFDPLNGVRPEEAAGEGEPLFIPLENQDQMVL